MDFYLHLKSDQPVDGTALEFANGRATMELLYSQDDGRIRIYRVLANLNTNVDLREYPWDRQTLPIVLEHKTRLIHEYTFVADEKRTGIDPDVKFVGWRLDGIRPRITEHRFQVYDEIYSQYGLDVQISRIRLPATAKVFLPISCFLLVVFLSLLIRIDKIENRLSIGIGVLIASVMFHISLTNSIPPVGYLTRCDKILGATYLIVVANLLLVVMQMRMMQIGREKP